MVSFRVKVWVTCIVFLSNGIFRSKSRGHLQSDTNFTSSRIMLFPAGLTSLRKSVSCDTVLASELSFDFIYTNKVSHSWYDGHRNKKCASSSLSNLQVWHAQFFGFTGL